MTYFTTRSKYWKVDFKVFRKCVIWVLAPQKCQKWCFGLFLGVTFDFKMTWKCIFHRNLKSLKNHSNRITQIPIFSVRGHTRLTHTQYIIFAKNCSSSESRFANKICPLSVQNDNIWYEHRSVFVKVFRYDTYIWKKFKHFYLAFSVLKSSLKYNFAPCAHHCYSWHGAKKPFITNIRYWTLQNPEK